MMILFWLDTVRRQYGFQLERLVLSQVVYTRVP